MPQLRIDNRKIAFLRAMVKAHGCIETITRQQIQKLVETGAPDPTWLWQGKDNEYRIGKGVFKIPDELLTIMRTQPEMTAIEDIVPATDLQTSVEDVGSHSYKHIEFDANYAAFVPPEDELYVPFGHYYDVATITQSGKFFPYWIYGLSGNGKTLSVEQAHSKAKKKLVMCPISKEADEDSLLGGLRLLNGDTVPFFGPVTMAAILGTTVCLDEIDQGDEKMMCLQTSLQNRPFLIKRLGKIIYPKPGFNIVATANTKGQGSEDGRFVGANIMNEAMLDRFVNVFPQNYPDADIEKQILQKVLASLGHTSPQEEDFIVRLLSWAKQNRDLYTADQHSEVITTRRLVHVCRSYDMYGKSRKKAIEKTISRFKDEVRSALLDCYKLIDDDWNKKERDAKRVAEAVKTGIDPETPW